MLENKTTYLKDRPSIFPNLNNYQYYFIIQKIYSNFAEVSSAKMIRYLITASES